MAETSGIRPPPAPFFHKNPQIRKKYRKLFKNAGEVCYD
jgi:hypothetical protein